MPTIYILKNIFFIKFFNSLDKLLKHINSNMNLKWNEEIFNSKIILDLNGNSYITLYNYEYDIMNIHIFEVEKINNISFIEHSIGTDYDYSIHPTTLKDFWFNVMCDLRKNYIKNKNICIEVENKLTSNCETICVQYSIKFSYKMYKFMYDIIYE
jgi:hypothetical protein